MKQKLLIICGLCIQEKGKNLTIIARQFWLNSLISLLRYAYANLHIPKHLSVYCTEDYSSLLQGYATLYNTWTPRSIDIYSKACVYLDKVSPAQGLLYLP